MVEYLFSLRKVLVLILSIIRDRDGERIEKVERERVDKLWIVCCGISGNRKVVKEIRIVNRFFLILVYRLFFKIVYKY